MPAHGHSYRRARAGAGTGSTGAFLMRGNYQRVTWSQTGQSWSTDTEVNTGGMSTYIVASTAPKVFAWVRWTGYIGRDSSLPGMFEVFVLKMKTSDGTPDLSTADTMEVLYRNGQVFFHDLYRGGDTTAWRLPKLKLEFKQVRLQPGEELRLIVVPWTTATNYLIQGVLEYREVVA